MKLTPRQSVISQRLVRYCQSGLVAVALCSSLLSIMAAPAQAGWRDLFRGETRGAASGRSRGGGIRDARCLTHGNSQELETRQEHEQMIALLPETPQRTTQGHPSFFLYLPFDRHNHDNMELVFELAIQAENSRQLVVDPIKLSLPNEPGLVEFQLPSNLPLENGQLYDWSFRLKCRSNQSVVETPPDATDSQAISGMESTENSSLEAENLTIQILAPTVTSENRVQRSGNVLQEVFGSIQRVERPLRLVTALGTKDTTDDYQAYLDNDLWFDLVLALETANSFADWSAFLEDEFDLVRIINDDLEPEVLNPGF